MNQMLGSIKLFQCRINDRKKYMCICEIKSVVIFFLGGGGGWVVEYMLFFILVVNFKNGMKFYILMKWLLCIGFNFFEKYIYMYI